MTGELYPHCRPEVGGLRLLQKGESVWTVGAGGMGRNVRVAPVQRSPVLAQLLRVGRGDGDSWIEM